MSKFDKGEKVYASDINALKASVKAEMQRRKQTGSLEQYGGVEFDYTDVPAKDKSFNHEHYSKLREPLAKISTSNLPGENKDATMMPSLTTLDARLTLNKSQTGKSSSSHGCMSSCSGLCYNSCSNCSGCTGCSSCGGTCSYCTGCDGCSGCGSGCASSCSGSCSGTCIGCGGGCSGCSSCGSSCSVGCGGKCSGYMNTM